MPVPSLSWQNLGSFMRKPHSHNTPPPCSVGNLNLGGSQQGQQQGEEEEEEEEDEGEVSAETLHAVLGTLRPSFTKTKSQQQQQQQQRKKS
jgi:hypothetical protein